jgi:hypothetical protein
VSIGALSGLPWGHEAISDTGIRASPTPITKDQAEVVAVVDVKRRIVIFVFVSPHPVFEQPDSRHLAGAISG